MATDNRLCTHGLHCLLLPVGSFKDDRLGMQELWVVTGNVTFVATVQ